MEIRKITEDLSVSPQISLVEVVLDARRSLRAVADREIGSLTRRQAKDAEARRQPQAFARRRDKAPALRTAAQAGRAMRCATGSARGLLRHVPGQCRSMLGLFIRSDLDLPHCGN
jgi:hypothetical protein